jgi:hypothetical protein
MAGDVPLLERLAALPPVPVSTLLSLLESLSSPGRDPLLAGLVGTDDAGEPVIHPLVPVVMEHLKERPDVTCYAALLEALTGIWNAAVRGAVVSRLRAQGLPQDDLLLRLEALSPTLGLRAENRDWARAWMTDPTAQDAALVQHCLVRLLLAMRGLAEGRARDLLDVPPASREERA